MKMHAKRKMVWKELLQIANVCGPIFCWWRWKESMLSTRCVLMLMLFERFPLKFTICGPSLFIHFVLRTTTTRTREKKFLIEKKLNAFSLCENVHSVWILARIFCECMWSCVCFFLSHAFQFKVRKYGGKEQSKWVNWSEKWYGPYDTYEVNANPNLCAVRCSSAIWGCALCFSVHRAYEKLQYSPHWTYMQNILMSEICAWVCLSPFLATFSLSLLSSCMCVCVYE